MKLTASEMQMGNHQKGYECFNILDKESNWSKAIYAYAKVRPFLSSPLPTPRIYVLTLSDPKGTMLYEMEGSDKSQANTIMKGVPDLMQRIAGKSIPLEVRSLLPPSRISVVEC